MDRVGRNFCTFLSSSRHRPAHNINLASRNTVRPKPPSRSTNAEVMEVEANLSIGSGTKRDILEPIEHQDRIAGSLMFNEQPMRGSAVACQPVAICDHFFLQMMQVHQESLPNQRSKLRHGYSAQLIRFCLGILSAQGNSESICSRRRRVRVLRIPGQVRLSHICSMDKPFAVDFPRDESNPLLHPAMLDYV